MIYCTAGISLSGLSLQDCCYWIPVRTFQSRSIRRTQAQLNILGTLSIQIPGTTTEDSSDIYINLGWFLTGTVVHNLPPQPTVLWLRRTPYQICIKFSYTESTSGESSDDEPLSELAKKVTSEPQRKLIMPSQAAASAVRSRKGKTAETDTGEREIQWKRWFCVALF